MQCPGSFAFVYSLSIQPGTNWTSWISFVVCGTFQGALIVMYYIFNYARNGYEPLDAEEDVALDSQIATTPETISPQAIAGDGTV
jgi:hypothetical protein